MRRKLEQSNDLLHQTQKIFHQFIQPTPITQAQFFKLFKLKMPIGQGTYGTIKCVQNCYEQLYAIKQSKDIQDTYGLYRQFSIMKKFNHPNILKDIAFFQIKQTQKLIILTELCKFKSLKSFSSYLTSMSFQQKVRLCVQIFNGIYALHQKNIMHRDLKPQNILIDENKRAKICDFGFCTYDGSLDQSKTQRVGTPLYNSPQTDLGKYTKKCDIFSYGLIVYYIFSNGKNLFKKNQASKDLQTQRQNFFKKGQKTFQDLEAPQKIKSFLQNTITRRQQNRFSTEQVRQFWHSLISQSRIRCLKVGELKQKYGSMLFIDEDDAKIDENQTEKSLKSQEKLAADLVVRIQNYSSLIKDSEKLSKFLKAVAQLQKTMGEFKESIQKVNIKITQKCILSFGCLFLYQLHLQNLLQSGSTFLKGHTIEQRPEIKKNVEEILKNILQMISAIGKNLLKSVVYLQRHNKLIQSTNLFSIFLTNCFEQTKRLQKITYENLNSGTGIQNFKTQKGIDQNRLLFLTVLKQIKFNVDSLKFKKEIDEVIKKFRSEKYNESSKGDLSLADQIFDKIKKIQFFRV